MAGSRSDESTWGYLQLQEHQGPPCWCWVGGRLWSHHRGRDCKSAESQLKWLTASRGRNCYKLWTSTCLFSVKQFLKVLQGCLSHHFFLKPISNPETENSYSYTISSAYCLIILNIGCSVPIFAMVMLDKIEKIKHTSMYVCLPLWEILYSLKTPFCCFSPSCVARMPIRTAHTRSYTQNKSSRNNLGRQ